MIRLKYERAERALRQADLAKLAKMTSLEVCYIESGRLKPTDKQAEKLAKALDWAGTPSELFEEICIRDAE